MGEGADLQRLIHSIDSGFRKKGQTYCFEYRTAVEAYESLSQALQELLKHEGATKKEQVSNIQYIPKFGI